MTAHTIRAMQSADIPAVVGIQEAIVKKQAAVRWKEALEHHINQHPQGCLVAVIDDRPIGFIIGEIKIWGFGLRRSGWIEILGIHPQQMGAGVGHALGRRLLDHFQKEGVDGIYTAVGWESGDLLSFFKSMGFEHTGLLNLKYKGPD